MSACIVVIEDEPDVLELLCDVLDSSGYSTVGLRDPELVRGMVSITHPDVFLLDLMLPGKSGIEVAQELRSDGFENTPMIAISASRLMLRTAVKSHLFQATIPKPFDVEEVIDCVEHCIA